MAGDTIGAAVDRLFTMRAKRKKAQAAFEAARAAETALQDEILAAFSKADIEGARGRLAQASVTRTEHLRVADPDAFGRYVLKHKALDLLQQRVSPEAVRARREQGLEVPGLDSYVSVRLSLTAAKPRK